MKLRLVLIGLFCCSSLAGCEEPEDTSTEFRSAPETSQVGIIGTNPIKVAEQCDQICVEIGCSDPCEVPTSSIEWLGEDKWLCTCECEPIDPMEFINACDPDGLIGCDPVGAGGQACLPPLIWDY